MAASRVAAGEGAARVASSPAPAPAYLELAMRRRLPLATRDAELLAAMKRCGGPVPQLAG